MGNLLYLIPLPKVNSVWNPTHEATNCLLWLDPTDNSKVNQSSGFVTTWIDKGTHAYTFNATTNTCTVVSSGIDSKQVVSLSQNTGTSGLTGPSGQKFVSTSTPWTVAFVAKLNTYTNGQCTFFVFSNGSSSDIYTINMQSSAETGYVGLNFASSTSTEYLQGLYNHTVSTGTIFKAVITYSGSNPTSTSSYQVYFNGVSQTVTTSPGGWSPSTQSGSSVGVIDSYLDYGGTWYAGDLMFFSETNSTLTSNINTFLLNKWGI